MQCLQNTHAGLIRGRSTKRKTCNLWKYFRVVKVTWYYSLWRG